MRKCPNCGVHSPDEIDLCDCGYRFSEQAIDLAAMPAKARRPFQLGRDLLALYAGAVLIVILVHVWQGSLILSPLGISLELASAFGLCLIPLAVYAISRGRLNAAYIALAVMGFGMVYSLLR